VFCVLLAIAAFVAPRWSRYMERAGSKPLSEGGQVAGKAPGRLGRWLQKPFGTSQRAVHKSGSAGRRGRSKMPL